LRALPLQDMARLLKVLESAHHDRRQVFLAGNGGSAATASHMANDLMKGVAKESGYGFRVRALTDNIPVITAIANDQSYSEVFAAQLTALAQSGDVLIVLSGSGNSPNIIRVVQEARRMQVTTIGILGMGGGQVAEMVDIAVIVPSNDYGPIEDVHIVFNHLITAYFQHWQTLQK